MSVLVALQHVTRYRYDRPVGLGPQIVRLRPAPHCRTAIRSYSLKVTPAEHFVNWLQDPNGNWLARFVFPERTTEFSITVDLLADMSVINPFDFFVDPSAENFPFVYPAEFDEELAPYLSREAPGPLLADVCEIDLARAAEDRRLPRRAQSAAPARHPLSRADGSRRADAGRHAEARIGLLPRHGVAAGADFPASRSRRAFRVGLPHPACAGPQGARRSGRHRLQTSPICTPGPKSTFRAPAGSGSIRRRDCSRARAICRSPPRRTIARPRRSAAASKRPASSSSSR